MVELYSCIAPESQNFFKQAVDLKQINFIAGAPCSRGPGQLPPLLPLNQALLAPKF